MIDVVHRDHEPGLEGEEKESQRVRSTGDGQVDPVPDGAK